MGPISYLIVEFPGNRMTGGGFEALIDLVDRDVVRIIDLDSASRRFPRCAPPHWRSPRWRRRSRARTSR
jgi:hypothetical protein